MNFFLKKLKNWKKKFKKIKKTKKFKKIIFNYIYILKYFQYKLKSLGIQKNFTFLPT